MFRRIAALALFAIVAAAHPALVQAEQMSGARLKEFDAVMPPAPAGYTRVGPVATYSSPEMSTVTGNYKSADGTKSFSVIVTFSSRVAARNMDLVANKKERESLYAMTAEKFKGRDMLVRLPTNKNKFLGHYIVMLGDGRMVSVNDETDTADAATLRTVLDSIDLDAIAKR